MHDIEQTTWRCLAALHLTGYLNHFLGTCTERYWTACMDSKSATPLDWCCRVCKGKQFHSGNAGLDRARSAEVVGTFRVSFRLCSTLPPYALPLCTGTCKQDSHAQLKVIQQHLYSAHNAPSYAKCHMGPLPGLAQTPSGRRCSARNVFSSR